jgi:hypothetical protein
MGVVLTMTMVVITALAITRERERGTMENLLATPVRPAEVMIGKILPYIAVGYIQVTLILIAAHFLFHVPMVGSLGLVYAVALLFIAANLAVGITFSTLAKNQLQAVQMAFFFFLPSILLSGFMFPFRGMPDVPAEHALPPHRPRHFVERKRPAGDFARDLAAGDFPFGRDDHRRETLPADAGLSGAGCLVHQRRLRAKAWPEPDFRQRSNASPAIWSRSRDRCAAATTGGVRCQYFCQRCGRRCAGEGRPCSPV